ncbi:MAG: TlpA family protein disulfide reductase [Cryomorphaceae bacterium]|nr:TlpA family protein disulfide reductase [Cryomorphaceae bacterium]
MSNILKLILCFFTLPFFAEGQNYLKGKMPNFPDQLVYLFSYEGYQSMVVDSARTNGRGEVVFKYEAPYQHGFLRLLVSQGNSPENSVYLDIAVEDSAVFFSEGKLITTSFSAGKLNIAFYDLSHTLSKLRDQRYALEEAMVVFEEDKSFFRRLNKQWKKNRKMTDEAYQGFYSKIGDSPFSGLIRAMEQWEPKEPELEEPSREDFWAGKSFDDPVLLRWNMISQKTLQYFSLYAKENLSYDEAMRGYRLFVSRTIEPLEKNTPLKENTLEFLVDGFTQMGIEEILDYIDERYFSDGLCGDENESLQQKLEAIRALKPGNRAPDLVWDGPNLQDIKSKYTLVIFFSPECPHCVEHFPDWVNTAGKYDSNVLQVVAISLDEGIEKLSPPDSWFVGVSEPTADAFKIRSTPNFILLDNQQKIVARMRDMDELKKHVVL